MCCYDDLVSVIVTVDMHFLEILATRYERNLETIEAYAIRLYDHDNEVERNELTPDEISALASLHHTLVTTFGDAKRVENLVERLRATIVTGHYNVEILADMRDHVPMAS